MFQWVPPTLTHFSNSLSCCLFSSVLLRIAANLEVKQYSGNTYNVRVIIALYKTISNPILETTVLEDDLSLYFYKYDVSAIFTKHATFDCKLSDQLHFM